MKKVFNAKTMAGSKRMKEPRLLRSIVEEKLQVWNRNTELSVDLKTILRSDRTMKTGKSYQGILRRDHDAEIEEFRCRDAHYTFLETVRRTAEKRNPHVFVGKYITVTRRDDESLRPNFKPLPDERDFDLEHYALGVYNEICMAFAGLIEEINSEK